MKARGLDLVVVEELHAKLLIGDERDVVLTSFNWLATSVDSTRSRGLEIGVHVVGPGPRLWLGDKLPLDELQTAISPPCEGGGQ